MSNVYDFGGYVTAYDRRCNDGRTILHSSFSGQLPCRVPLVWHHNGTSTPTNVLGYIDLTDDQKGYGVYGFGKLLPEGESHEADHARNLIKHGAIDSMSIFAGDVRERPTGNGTSDVFHGVIKEVSLVIAGCNPGAKIDVVGEIKHSDMPGDETIEYSAIINTGDSYIITPEDLEGTISHADTKESSKKERTVTDVLNSMDQEQLMVVAYLLEQQKGKDDEEKSKSNKDNKSEGETNMAHSNLFEQVHNQNAISGDGMTVKRVMTHADEAAVLQRMRATNAGSFKETLTQYAREKGYLKHDGLNVGEDPSAEYGIENYEILFYDAKLVGGAVPRSIDRQQDWVKYWQSKTTHCPYSRFKTMHADLTPETLRAKGYPELGVRKLPQVLKVAQRAVSPTTAYVMMKMDKDVLRDITTFDPIRWQEGIMDARLREEIARAGLIGDGRDPFDPHKIKEDCVIPVLNDDDFYCIKYKVPRANADTERYAWTAEASIANNIIDAATLSQEEYRGSGNLTFFTSQKWKNKMLMLKTVNGERIYKTEAELCAAMGISSIHVVEQFRGLTRTDENNVEREVAGILINPADYQYGSDQGSAIETFKQFDIHYNQEEILKETRLSGMLVQYHSAIVLEIANANEAA